MDTIIYILLFAIATVIISCYGIVKEKNKSKDLLSVLYAKSYKAIMNSFKKKDTLSRKDMENEIINLKASLFYSRDKLVIQNPSHMTTVMIGKMLNEGIIMKTSNGYSLKKDEK